LKTQLIKNNANDFNNLRVEMNKHLFPIVIAVFALISFQCSSSKSLSDTEKTKLDPVLLHLLSGDRDYDKRLEITHRADGTKEYAVIVLSEHPEAIRALGINVSSVFGDIIVVHATIEELKNIVSLSTVQSVRTGSKRTIQQQQ
jgi:predicted AlkP superfamily pyrophosphatase or phosphodiesterase